MEVQSFPSPRRQLVVSTTYSSISSPHSLTEICGTCRKGTFIACMPATAVIDVPQDSFRYESPS
jgi:hypothetical protein